MALPKLNDIPKYELTIPSTNQTVKFRPYLVKEEKVLMLAFESQDQNAALNAVVDTLRACIQEDLDIDKLKTDGFEQHAEILCKIVKKSDKFYEVPINYNGRSAKEGKKIKFYHFFTVIYRILIERF